MTYSIMESMIVSMMIVQLLLSWICAATVAVTTAGAGAAVTATCNRSNVRVPLHHYSLGRRCRNKNTNTNTNSNTNTNENACSSSINTNSFQSFVRSIRGGGVNGNDFENGHGSDEDVNDIDIDAYVEQLIVRIFSVW